MKDLEKEIERLQSIIEENKKNALNARNLISNWASSSNKKLLAYDCCEYLNKILTCTGNSDHVI